MLKKVRIQNFKSIADETIELGRINVFIGENGCGKSNLLEAFAYLAGAMSNRLTLSDMELRGVRVAKPQFTVSAFEEEEILYLYIYINSFKLKYQIIEKGNNNIFGEWDAELANSDLGLNDILLNSYNDDRFIQYIEFLSEMKAEMHESIMDYEFMESGYKQRIYDDLYETYILIKSISEDTKDYLIYQFDTPVLRGFGRETYAQPLGIRGEGLDVLFNSLDKDDRALVLEKMGMIGWLNDIKIDKDGKLKSKSSKVSGGNSELYFEDQYMTKGRNLLSAENANEGVLHLLACITAVVSSYTPRFFAIDNVDATLNPHLCRALVEVLADLTQKNGKQLLLTTQNPAILDGLNINDDDERLFAVYRDDEGKTRVKRIQIREGWLDREHKLSEMWMRGSFKNAIPKHF